MKPCAYNCLQYLDFIRLKQCKGGEKVAFYLRLEGLERGKRGRVKWAEHGVNKGVETKLDMRRDFHKNKD